MSQIPEQLRSAIASRYLLERQVGRGGMATVYLGRDLKHDRPVAVKVLLPALGALLGAERFLREIKLVARLQHPYILPLYDSGEADGMLYYIMPYVSGDSLRDRLRRERRLPIRDALWIARDVADALYYAHGNDIVHRDIKPENILLSGAHAIVADFGIARAVHVAGGEKWETLTESGVAVGTPAYMSPEQTVGDTDVDGRSDVYSLGCVLYEMLAGSPPFTGPDGEVLLAKRFTDTPPALRAVRADVPPVVEEAVTKALAREPADRFANALDLTHAIWEDRTTTLHPGGREKTRNRTSHRTVWLASGGIGIAVVVGGGLTVARYRATSRPAPPVHTVSVAATGRDTAADRETASAHPDTAAASAAAAQSVTVPPPIAHPTVAPAPTPAASSAPVRRHETRVAKPRADTVLASLRASAIQARARAAAAGAMPLDLAAGDSLLTASDTSAAGGRRSDAIIQLSTAASEWTTAARTAQRRSALDSQPSRRTPAGSTGVAKLPASASAPERNTDTAAVRRVLPDPRPEIRALIGRYARAIESRSVPAIGQLYPAITVAQQRDWEQFFRTVRDITVHLTVTRLEVTGASADAQIEGTYEYANTSTRRFEQHPVLFHASLQRDAGGWRLRSIQ